MSMKELVSQLIESGHLRDPRLIEALEKTDRRAFLPKEIQRYAYYDSALVSYSDGREVLSTSTQPSLHVSMLESLDLKTRDRVLEIGTGTGFGSCLLARLLEGGRVVSLEVNEPVAQKARENISNQGIDNVEVIVGDGREGFASGAPYDGLIAMVALEGLNKTLFSQLRIGARAVLPVFKSYDDTPVYVFRKIDENSFDARELTGAIFMSAKNVSRQSVYDKKFFRAKFSGCKIEEIQFNH